eukprot:TRINITY_DN12886_c0_g1_i1.p2 TRINITY_DN12886_c0_g1~~TRINITY_DN12886_c0_g1_i1.p2  ORF type:complete len:204 (+),score=87.94 TRINITY_DN12886_c0_g1_i1:71-613(+)
MARNAAAATQAVGTPGYIAPEVAMAGHITPACDVYALGVTALQLVAGLAAPVLRNQHILRYTIDQLRPTPVSFPTTVEKELLRLAAGCTQANLHSRFKLKAVIVCLQVLVDTPEGGLEDVAPKECVVCLEHQRQVRLPCGHKVLCEECVDTVTVCPMCRHPFERPKTTKDMDLNTFVGVR